MFWSSVIASLIKKNSDMLGPTQYGCEFQKVGAVTYILTAGHIYTSTIKTFCF